MVCIVQYFTFLWVVVKRGIERIANFHSSTPLLIKGLEHFSCAFSKFRKIFRKRKVRKSVTALPHCPHCPPWDYSLRTLSAKSKVFFPSSRAENPCTRGRECRGDSPKSQGQIFFEKTLHVRQRMPRGFPRNVCDSSRCQQLDEPIEEITRVTSDILFYLEKKR